MWKGPDSWVLPGWAQLWVVLTEGAVTVKTRRRSPTMLGAAVLYGGTSCAMPVTSQGGVTIVIDLTPAGFACIAGRSRWTLMHALGAAPDLDASLKDPADRDAARTWMELSKRLTPDDRG